MKNSQPRLNTLSLNILIAAIVAAGAWLTTVSVWAAADGPVSPPAAKAESAEGEGELLATIERQNRLIAEVAQKEVEVELELARTRMRTDPASVEGDLKLVIERVVQTPELRAELRATLRGQLETALRQAASLAAAKDVLDNQTQQARAAALDRSRVANAMERDQERAKQLLDRFNSLMDEGRYTAADNLGSQELQAAAPDLPIATSARLVGHLAGARDASLALRRARQKGVVDTLQTVETSHIPLPDDQPVVYPDADVWFDLSMRRQKYREAVDLKKIGAAERHIRDELNQPTQMRFADVPLTEALAYLSDLHGIAIQLDLKNLDEANVSPDVPLSMSLQGVSLRSGLKLLLGRIGLAYFIENEVLLITTPEVATGDRAIVRKAYPVADLVVPVPASGGMGNAFGGGQPGGGVGNVQGGGNNPFGGPGNAPGGNNNGFFAVPPEKS